VEEAFGESRGVGVQLAAQRIRQEIVQVGGPPGAHILQSRFHELLGQPRLNRNRHRQPARPAACNASRTAIVAIRSNAASAAGNSSNSSPTKVWIARVPMSRSAAAAGGPLSGTER
jgi:hypothetical protein